MTTPDEPNAILDKIAKGTHTKADIIALRDAVNVSGDRNVVQLGKYNVNIIGEGGDVQVGDRTYYGADAETIKAVLQEILSEFQVSVRPTGIPQNIPLSGVVKFVGRDEELVAVHEKLQEAATVAISSVSGMGGVGKTELALQYAYSKLREEAYPGGICWVQARVQDVGIGILEFARNQLGLPQPPEILNTVPQQVKWVCDRWQGKPILLVLDDVVDYEVVQPYLQQLDSRFRVLMTTRLKLGTPGKRLELKELREGAALELLRVLVNDAERINSQLADAQQLCEWLGYLPLGLELVGRYLAEDEDISLAEMLDLLKQELLAKAELWETYPDMTASLTVAAAFELSWKELDQEAKTLSCLLGIFALAPIPWELVEQCLPDWEKRKLAQCRDQQLKKRSLLSRVGQKRYELHQLIREFFAVKLERELGDVAQGLQRRFALVLTEVAKTIPHPVMLEVIARVEEALPHLAVVAERLTHLIEDEDAKWSFAGLARVAEAQSRWQEAEQWHTNCLQMTETCFGSNHPDVATSLNNLALLYKAQGRYIEAEPLYLQALELYKRLLGDHHPDVAMSLNNLAALYKAQGRYIEAESLYLQALELYKRLPGDNHPDVAISLNNLANLYYAQGRYIEAEPLYLQALELRKRQLGDNHPHVAISLNNLALLYEAQGRYIEAEPLYLQALELYKRLLGDNHPDVAMSLSNLALLYEAQGRYIEAEPLLLQALELYKRLLGDNHPHVAMSLNNLANLYEAQGRYIEAEPLLLQALELYKRLLGDNHPHVAMSLNNLANLYYAQGRYIEAEPLYLQALELYKRLLGDNHPDVATSLNNLAGLYEAQGRYEEAEPLYLQALELYKRLLGNHHRDVAMSLNNLANLYEAQGRYEEAEPLLLRTLEIWMNCLGKNHPHTQTAWNNFRCLIQQAVQNGKAGELSAHPLTQRILQEVRPGE